MELLCVGLSHKTAPIEVREKLALPIEDQEAMLRDLLKELPEALLISTCNRVEFYVVHGSSDQAKRRVRSVISSNGRAHLVEHLYEHGGEAALVHLFRVTASLDSMVVGEPQILGQVKEALELAQRVGAAGGELARACSAAFGSAKRVRSETAIGRAAVSMAGAAVELASKIFGTLSGRSVLLVGAGEMAELAAKHLVAAGALPMVVVNRTLDGARALAAAIGATAKEFSEIYSLLGPADLVVCSTASPSHLFTRENVSPVLKSRRFRPLFMVDLAVPRDIDPKVNELEGVYAYDIDDIQQIVADNWAGRVAEVAKAEVIIAEEIANFVRSRSVRENLPVLAQLRARAEQIALAEAERTLAHFGVITDRQRRGIQAMAMAIVNKLLHEPTAKLREQGPDRSGNSLAGAAAELFGLEQPGPSSAGSKESISSVSKIASADRGGKQ
jgi:glutamyl-tRNA reductase